MTDKVIGYAIAAGAVLVGAGGGGGTFPDKPVVVMEHDGKRTWLDETALTQKIETAPNTEQRKYYLNALEGLYETQNRGTLLQRIGSAAEFKNPHSMSVVDRLEQRAGQAFYDIGLNGHDQPKLENAALIGDMDALKNNPSAHESFANQLFPPKSPKP